MAAIFQHSPMVLITRKADRILGPLELKNKRVMRSLGLDDAVITAMLNQQGLRPDDMIHIPQNFDQDALIRGDIDAMEGYLTDQPYYYREKGLEVNVINPLNYGIDFYGDILFTTEQQIKEKPQQTLAFLKASIRGWEYALRHKDETIAIIRSKYSQEHSVAKLRFEADETERMIRPDLIPIGYMNTLRFLRIADIYRHEGMAGKDVDIEGIDYKSYLEDSTDLSTWVRWVIISAIVLMAIVFVMVIINARLKTLVNKRTNELQALQQDLENQVSQRTAEAVAANKAKSIFLANMSHELRTPMHSIYGFANLALKKATDEKQHRHIQNIITSSSRLTRLLNDLLDLSKLESNRMEMKFLDHDLVVLAHRAIEDLTPQIEDKKLKVYIEHQFPMVARCDEDRIYQVFINLLSNAVRFSPENRDIKILFSLRQNENVSGIEVVVQNFGPPIPSAELNDIFDKFVQSSRTDNKAGGTGLGLAICREILHSHQGDIHADSTQLDEQTKDNSVRFIFWLPVTLSPG